MYKIGDDKRNHQRACRYRKLSDGSSIGQPRENHKADAKERAHIVYHKTVALWIKHTEQNDGRIKDNLLKRIKKQIRHIACLKAYHHKTAEMQRKHQYVLSCVDAASSALLLKAENGKAFPGIQDHQQRYNILRKFADIQFHLFYSSFIVPGSEIPVKGLHILL